MLVKGLDVKSINVSPRGVCGVHKFFVTGMKRLSVNVCPRDIRESVGVTPDSDLPGVNGIGQELYLKGMNDLNGIGLESDQEHTLSRYEF